MDRSTPGAPGPELSELGDPAFLAERRRVRSLLEQVPAREAEPGLAEWMRELDEEFLRRARIAWRDAR